MEAMQPEPAGPAKWICAGCGKVIGVYEPLVHVVGAIAHRTSRAADPELGQRHHGRFYHPACSHLAGPEFVSVE
jgi:hypothetical protein